MCDMDKRRYVQTAPGRVVGGDPRGSSTPPARPSSAAGRGAARSTRSPGEAGVSRSTVYLLYGSRAGLFDALARYLRDEAGFDELIAAFAAARTPSTTCATSQRAAVAMYAPVPDLARALFTLAAIDPDAVAAVRAIEDGRRPGMVRLAGARGAGLPAR